MSYSSEQISEFMEAFQNRTERLYHLQTECLSSYKPSDGDKVREYLFHGVSRRLGLLRYAVTNVFSDFPLATNEKLNREILLRVQVTLQAFFINLIGVFDNFAWCYLHLHRLEEKVRGQNVDMFKERMQSVLPPEISSYLVSEQTQKWHANYFKNYRDALAHRIPLYVPPAIFTKEEGKRYEEIQEKINEAITRHEFDLADVLKLEQDTLGSPSFVFMHSFSEEGATGPLFLHPQMLRDAETVVEFGNLFLKHWRDGPPPAE